MSNAQTPDVIRRTASEISRELERRSRPDSAHKGNLKRLKTSSVSGFQRWEKENELLWAMLEDETEWLAQLFPDIVITPELFFYSLEDGVVLCRLANLIQEKAEEYGKKNNVSVTGKRFRYHTSIPKKNKQLALFKSRENVQGFLTWCRQLGISDSILFESNDIVEADECREGCREVVICLMEIARRASGRFKFTPIPKLIQLEKEIEAEEQQDAENNALDQVDYGSSDEESNDSGHSPNLEHSSPPGDPGNDDITSRKGKKKPKKQQPKSELDKEVFKIIDNFNVYNIRKIKEGKYLILGKIIFVRMLNGHILLRIGGGWDTLEHYLMTHIPKVENGQISSEAAVSPSVSKTPQKSQLTKLLDKVKKEQQLKGTPVSSPYRPAAAKSSKQPDDSSEDDEKDITSAIRKIEFSVNQNIATRRKLSKVLVEETPQKSSSTTSENSRSAADINQNSITHEQKTSEVPPSQSPQEKQKSPSGSPTKKMEGEESKTGAFSEEINAKGEPNFGSVEQNDGKKVIEVAGSCENGSSETNEPIMGQGDNEIAEHATDSVDGVSMADLHPGTKPRDSPDIKISECGTSEDPTHDSSEAKPCNSVDSVNEPGSHEDDLPIEETPQNPSNNDIKEQPSAGVNSKDNPDILPSSVEKVAVSVEVTKDSDKPTPAAEASDPVPAGNASPDSDKGKTQSHEEKPTASPKKKTSAKSTKETLKTKQAPGKSSVSKKETSASTAKSAQSKTSGKPPSQSASTRTTKRPMSAAKSTTATSKNTSPTSSTSTSTKRTSPTHTATSKKPTSKPEPKAIASTGQTRLPKTTAFGSTVSKPPPKKHTDSGRPATAPLVKSSHVKGKPAAAKVQSGLSSARPHSAKPLPKAATAVGKGATDGGAIHKETGKPSNNESATRAKSPTKPPVRKTQVKTVTTVKTTKAGTSGEPEVKSQTLKTTKTVTEAHGKKTTKTTVKEIAPTGRKPLRMTKMETAETRELHGKKKANGSMETKTGGRAEKPGTKKPETKNKVGNASKAGVAGASKRSGGPGTKKVTTKAGMRSEQKVSSHLKGTMHQAKTVKELSNALGITKPAAALKSTKKAPEVEAKPDDKLKIETISQEEVKNSTENTTGSQEIEDTKEVNLTKQEKVAVETENEKVVEESEKVVEKEVEIVAKNEEHNEELLDKRDTLTSEEDKKPTQDFNKELVKKEGAGERQDELVPEKLNKKTAEDREQDVSVENKLIKETGREVPENNEVVKEEQSEKTDKEETLEEAKEDDRGVTPESGLTQEELESLRSTSSNVTSEEKLTVESHVSEEVAAEGSEKSSFPEMDNKFAEDAEGPTQGSVGHLEEILDDNIDIIEVTPQEIPTEHTKIESTEAWPAVDVGRELVSNEETGGKGRYKLNVIGESKSSPNVVEDGTGEELKHDTSVEKKPDADSPDPDANQAIYPTVSPPTTVETEREGEPSDVGDYEKNNNTVQVNLDQDPHLTTNEPTFPESSIPDQMVGGALDLDIGDDKTKTLPSGEVIQSDEVAQKNLGEWSRPEKNEGAPPSTVDDLLT